MQDFKHSIEIEEMRYLRRQIQWDFAEWLGLPQLDIPKCHIEMAKLLGFKGSDNLTFYKDEWTDNHAEVLQKLRLLNSPHGYAVLKMLQAQNDPSYMSNGKAKDGS